MRSVGRGKGRMEAAGLWRIGGLHISRVGILHGFCKLHISRGGSKRAPPYNNNSQE